MARQKINAGSQLSVPVTATPVPSAAAALTSAGNIQGQLTVEAQKFAALTAMLFGGD